MKKSTMIRSLLLSGLSVLLCVSMLMGSTFAWFTDEVKSGNNTIIAGNLDVELYNGLDNTADKVMSDTKLFDDIKLWEPGAATFENLTVANEGNLALMYNLSVNVGNAQGAANLADVLKVGVVANGIADNASREEVLAAVTEWMPFMSFVKSGKLYPANSTEGVSTTTYGIVIWWEPSDKDNDYNMNNGKTDADQLKIDIGVTLIATQVEAEQDAFGSDYDANAKNEFLAVVTADSNKPTTINSPYAPSILTPITTIEAATGSFETGTVVSAQITTSGTLFNVTAEGDVVGSINVEISAVDANGQEVSTDGKSYTVTTYVAKGLSDVVVEYTGDDGKAQPADIVYDAETGKLTFVTTHFSEYAVSGKAIAYDLAKDTIILSAIFRQ